MYGQKYTEEEKAFMREYVPGHSYHEIQQAFCERFNRELSMGQIKSYIGNHHLNTGRNGRFAKGQRPHNKGVKMSKEMYEKASRTMFRKGNIPANHRPVGSERVNVYGYVEIKVREPNKWRLKHNVVWEQHHGEIPKGYVVISLDRNPLNVSIENLKLIKRSELLIMNRQNLFGESREINEVSTNLARLINATHIAKRGENPWIIK